MLHQSLGGLDIRYNSETGLPEWKERGADTFNPFKSTSFGESSENGNIYNGITVEVGRKVNNVVLITGQSETYPNYKGTTTMIINNECIISRTFSHGGLVEAFEQTSFYSTDTSFTIKNVSSEGYNNAPYYWVAW